MAELTKRLQFFPPEECRRYPVLKGFYQTQRRHAKQAMPARDIPQPKQSKRPEKKAA